MGGAWPSRLLEFRTCPPMLGQIDLSCPIGGALLWQLQVRSQSPTTSPLEPRTSSSWLPSSGPGRTLGFGREVTSPGDKGRVTRVNQDAPGTPGSKSIAPVVSRRPPGAAGTERCCERPGGCGGTPTAERVCPGPLPKAPQCHWL